MIRIVKYCGENDYSVNFYKKIDLNKVREIFKDFNELERTDETLELYKDNKKIVAFAYGEILFLNFPIEEVEEYVKAMEKLL